MEPWALDVCLTSSHLRMIHDPVLGCEGGTGWGVRVPSSLVSWLCEDSLDPLKYFIMARYGNGIRKLHDS